MWHKLIPVGYYGPRAPVLEANVLQSCKGRGSLGFLPRLLAALFPPSFTAFVLPPLLLPFALSPVRSLVPLGLMWVIFLSSFRLAVAAPEHVGFYPGPPPRLRDGVVCQS
jgi:hypothetical protein